MVRTQTQNAGYSRTTRLTKKSRGVRPQQLMQMTNPLIMKNSSTPSQPYPATLWASGKSSAVLRPQAPRSPYRS